MSAVDTYFALADGIRAAKRDNDYEQAAEHARATTPLFAPLVSATMREYGRWDIVSSVAVTEGAAVLMALGDHAGLNAMRAVLRSLPQLSVWADDVEHRARLARIGDRLVEHLGARGPCSQADAKDALGVEDGREFSNLCSWLAKVGRIDREKRGKSYTLRPVGT